MEEIILKPTSNYLTDSRPPDAKMVAGMVQDIKSLKDNPINSSVTFSFPVVTTNFEGRNAINYGLNYIVVPSNNNSRNFRVPPIREFKLTLPNYLNFSFGISLYYGGLNFATLPSSNFTFKVYYQSFLHTSNSVNTIFSAADLTPLVLFEVGTIGVTTTGAISYTPNIISANLIDTIESRTFDSNVLAWDFSANNLKIPLPTLEQLLNGTDNYWSWQVGYDASALTGNNLTFYNNNFLINHPAPEANVRLSATHNLTYFGITASYQLLN